MDVIFDFLDPEALQKLKIRNIYLFFSGPHFFGITQIRKYTATHPH